MKSGLLWYDGNGTKSLWDKIDEATQRYYEKFGVAPNTCYVNPKALPEGKTTRGNLRVVSAPTILPNHLWLGISD